MTVELGLDDKWSAPKALEDGIHIFCRLSHLRLHTSSDLQVLLTHHKGCMGMSQLWSHPPKLRLLRQCLGMLTQKSWEGSMRRPKGIQGGRFLCKASRFPPQKHTHHITVMRPFLPVHLPCAHAKRRECESSTEEHAVRVPPAWHGACLGPSCP